MVRSTRVAVGGKAGAQRDEEADGLPGAADNSAAAAARRFRAVLRTPTEGRSGPLLLTQTQYYLLSNRLRMREPFPEQLVEELESRDVVMLHGVQAAGWDDSAPASKSEEEAEDLALRLAAIHDDLSWGEAAPGDVGRPRRAFRLTQDHILEMTGRRRRDYRFDANLAASLWASGFYLLRCLTVHEPIDADFVVMARRVLKAVRTMDNEDIEGMFDLGVDSSRFVDRENIETYLLMDPATLNRVRLLSNEAMDIYPDAKAALDVLVSEVPA